MSEKKRLTTLAGRIAEANKVTEKVANETNVETLVANRPHGEKADHVKITVTLPPEIYKLISDEVTRRKMMKEPNPQLSAVIREAIVAKLQREA